jgi:ABC-type lipoprotein release transport system permease subunit
MIQFGPLTILMILGLALVTATLASFIPCYLISSKRPIDSINDK